MPHFLNKYRKIILAIFPFIVFLILRSVGFDGLYGQDGYEYLRYSKDLVSFIKTNELPKPFSWPVLYPISGAIIYTIIQEMGLALQLISILAWSGVTIYLHATLKLLFPKKSTSFFFIFLCFLLSPMVLRMGVVVMSDMLATCFIVMSCFYALRYGQRINTKDLYLFSFFSISSMLTRYASFIALVPFFLYVAFFLLKNKKQWIHILPLMILLGGLCIPHF
ncbi:glycosyltransferase family 39 protein, partial [Saprospiraceae bacterium]|nr:glycosyltransferase family 39 protein [Saprospiraceae bacterium]